MRLFEMTMRRLFNAMVCASIASALLMFALYLGTSLLGFPEVFDFLAYDIGLNFILLLLGAPLFVLWFSRLDHRARLTLLEREIVTRVAVQLPLAERDVWDQQVQAISRVERVPSGDEIRFHLGGTGRNPYLPLPLLINRNSFAIAVLKLTVPRLGAVAEVTVWCDQGRLSSIVFRSDAGSLASVTGVTSVTEISLTGGDGIAGAAPSGRWADR